MIDMRIPKFEEILDLRDKHITDLGTGKTCIRTDIAILTSGFGSSNIPDDVYYVLLNTNEIAQMITGERMTDSQKMSSLRPVIRYSQIKDWSNVTKDYGAYKYITFGEYPDAVVPDKLAKTLSKLKKDGTLQSTGKTYRIPWYDSLRENEFEYLGQKYICFDTNKGMITIYNKNALSNGKFAKYGKEYWIKVSPVSWVVDVNEDIAISTKILTSNITLGNTLYSQSTVKDSVDTLMNEIIPSHIYDKIKEKNGVIKDEKQQSQEEIKENGPKAKKKDNVYDFNLERVDEEDIIKGCIEGDIPVFLHGQSSEGKSARVKQIDPDCTILYLSNATPESLNGKSVYDPNKGEIVDVAPSWYTKLVSKCEAEPDKVHVLFFDELTNALPSIQGMAFNIILDREVNGVWKLPTNCRIAASGNDMDESLAANELAKPLFNRLAHVYIKTTVPNWLNWASKNNIHPAIYAFVAYNGEKVLRTEYNGEKPHADPRRWEMASKLLYATNTPHLLRGIIGEGVTAQLVAFCKQTVITLEDVLNHNYTKEDLKMDIGQKYMTAVGLSLVDEKNLKEVRDFTYNLGSEIGAVFDSMWCHGDVERIIKLAELEAIGGIKR